MTRQQYLDERLTIQALHEQYKYSEKSWRRALNDPVDPLPYQRVGNGDPKHGRILVRRGDVEAWLQRRNAALTEPIRDIVDEMVAKVTEDAA